MFRSLLNSMLRLRSLFPDRVAVLPLSGLFMSGFVFD